MIAVPVARSKLIMPQLPFSMVASERIERLSQDICGHQVTVITAPAGYGKSTLTAFALHSREDGNKIRWYRLDEEDQDLAVFFSYLTEMLFPQEEDIWVKPRQYLSECRDIHNQHKYLLALYCQELWSYSNHRQDQTTFIVFDDYQEIARCPAIVSSIQYLVENLPANCKTIVNSRCECTIVTPKRVLNDEVMEISADELSLTENELACLIKSKTCVEPDLPLLHNIMLQTEGWLAGAILFCQLLNTSEGFMLSSVPRTSRGREFLFEYIVQEVIKSIDMDLLHFILKLAVLKDWTLEQAAVIFDEPDVARLMAECERQELFVQKTFGQVATYRFHALFRETLLRIQNEYSSGEEIDRFHLNAAAYYIANRVFDRAIEHFISCGNIRGAVELITLESMEHMAYDLPADTGRWLSLLPEEVVQKNGFLLFIKAYTFQPVDHDQSTYWFERALSIFEESHDIVMQVYTAHAILNNLTFRNDSKGMGKYFALLKTLEENDPPECLSFKFKTIRLIRALWTEQYEGMEEAIRDAFESASSDDEWMWFFYVYSAFLYYLLGKPGSAVKSLEDLLKLDIARNMRLPRGYSMTLYSIFLQLNDDHDKHYHSIKETIEMGEIFDYTYFSAYGYYQAALYRYRRHDLDNALEAMEISANYFEELHNRPFAALARLHRCLWLCRKRDPAGLLAEAQSLTRRLTAKPTGYGLQEIGLSICGAVALEAGDYALAEKTMQSAVRRSRRKGTLQILAGNYMHLAWLYYRKGDQVRGRRQLMRAMDLCVENNFLTIPGLYYPMLIEMAARCIKSHIHPDYAVALVSRHFDIPAAEFLVENAAATGDEDLPGLTETFLDRFENRIDTIQPTVSLNLLGRFRIAVNGEIIPDYEWKTRKISGILKYLILRRGNSVLREQLMDVFWPDADKSSAQMSLRAALYELKKVLRKYGAEDESGASFLNDKRDRLEVQTGRLLSVDIDMFLACHSELGRLGSGNPSRRRALLEKMTALYQGDLLENDSYEDWLFAEREELKSIYLKSVTDLAGIYEAGGSELKAEKLLLKLLDCDPYNEDACFSLARLYIAKKQRSRAVSLYNDFSERLNRDLGIRPQESLSELIQGLKNA